METVPTDWKVYFIGFRSSTIPYTRPQVVLVHEFFIRTGRKFEKQKKL